MTTNKKAFELNELGRHMDDLAAAIEALEDAVALMNDFEHQRFKVQVVKNNLVEMLKQRTERRNRLSEDLLSGREDKND